jgi:plastocyanin
MLRIAKALAVGSAFLSGAALAQAYTQVDVTGGGTISGQITFRGAKPALPPEKRNKDPKVCGTTGPNQSLIVSSGGGVKNVIVYLKDISSGKKMDLAGTATLDQSKCSYGPHVQALPVGTTLTVLNSDPILHNVHASQGPATVFNYAMPIKDQKIPKKLTKPGFIKLKCDVHGWMNGAIGVMTNPYYAVTGDDGSYSISDVPPGTYTLATWHETLGEKTQQLTVAAGATATADVQYAK